MLRFIITHTLKPSHPQTGPMGIGDTFEIELSQFGLPVTIGGQANYGTAFLYKWEQVCYHGMEKEIA